MLEDLEQFPLKVRAGEDEGDILAGLNARELEMALDLRPWMQVLGPPWALQHQQWAGVLCAWQM